MTQLNYYLLLALGSLGLSLVLTYAFWLKVRDWRFQADVLRIRTEFQKQGGELNCLGDPAYRSLAQVLDALIENPGLVSWSAVISYSFCDVKDRTLHTENVDLRRIVEQTRRRLAARSLGRLLYEDLLGCFFRLWLPRILAQTGQLKVERQVERYVVEVREFPEPAVGGWDAGRSGRKLAGVKC